MHVDIPQWLPQAYVRAVQAAGSPLSKEDVATFSDDGRPTTGIITGFST